MKKIVIIFMVCILIGFNSASGQNPTLKSTTDLNGDNKAEEISLEPVAGSYAYYLDVSGQKVRGEFEEGEVDGFFVIDINKYDKYKEIAVHTPGPSDDHQYRIYWYDGEAVHEMTTIWGLPEYVGNGILYIDSWMAFWTKRDKYVLDDNTRTLEYVPQYLHYVGVKVTVRKSFPIFSDKELTKKVALLRENSEIEILLCDMEGRSWNDIIYLIKSSSNLVGWVRYIDMFDNVVGLPLAD